MYERASNYFTRYSAFATTGPFVLTVGGFAANAYDGPQPKTIANFNHYSAPIRFPPGSTNAEPLASTM